MKRKRIWLPLIVLLLLTLFGISVAAVMGLSTEESGMHLQKTATANADGTYTITLEAYATGDKVISQVSRDVPTDIVLVLDLSSSMTEQMGVSGSGTRLAALKDAVLNFVESVAEKSMTLGVAHRIAVVGYHKTMKNYTLEYATETGGLVSMTTETGKNNVLKAIAALKTSQGTVPSVGLAEANAIFSRNPVGQDESRNRVVVLFTDGYPSTTGSTQITYSLCDSAIAESQISKNTYGATVYSVGVFSGANPSLNIFNNFSNSDKNLNTAQKNVAANRFMHYVSSNYPAAKSITENSVATEKMQYYLSAENATELNAIFQQIFGSIESGGAYTALGAETVIRDEVAMAFSLPEGADITLKTYSCVGKDGDYLWQENMDAMGAQATLEGDTVSVTGFDFAQNYVGTVTENGVVSYCGSKLVISFTVEVQSGFLGGNDVYTNTEAGVYENAASETPVLFFERPQVDVPIPQVMVSSAQKNVYYMGGDVTATDVTVMVGDVALDLSRNDFGLESWQKEYVDISAIIPTLEKTENGTYEVKVTVKPIYDGTVNQQSGSGYITVAVFLPELKYRDGIVWYGGAMQTDLENNLVVVTWRHDNEVDTAVTMSNTMPVLNMEYRYDTDTVRAGLVNTKRDIPVDVTVVIDGWDITDVVAFTHRDCTEESFVSRSGCRFVFHVKTCTLTVRKTGGEEGEPYVFTVYRDGAVYTAVTVMGNGSERICELPVGVYTIEEDSGWSWRYEPIVGDPVVLNGENPAATICCENHIRQKTWLNGFGDVVENVFESGGV